MGWFTRFIDSSIGKKYVMGFTGFLLIIYLIEHLAGNLSLFWGKEAFNGYAAALETLKPVLRVIEVLLALVFIFHILNGVRLWFLNKRAKPVKYAMPTKSKNRDLSSRTMIITGGTIFVFLVLHLATIWFKYNFDHTGETLYDIVVRLFANPYYSIFYVLAMILLGYHLNHGFQSAFQTFGWNHKKYFPLIQKVGTIYAIVMAVGFASIPIYFLLSTGGK